MMDNRIKLKTAFFNLIGIMAIETLAFVWLISGSKYDPSVAIGIILFIPLLFGLNIVFGSLLLMLKLKNISLAIFVNAIASPLIFYFLWTYLYIKIDKTNSSIYSFNSGQSQYEIILSKNDNDFSITDVISQHDGTTIELYHGKIQVKADSIILVGDIYNMIIVNGRLFNFPQDSSAIDLKKIGTN